MTKKQAQPEPWERQKGETDPAFEAFALYRNMGVERSTLSVSIELSKSHGLVKKWGTKQNWVSRAAAFDDHLDKIWIKEKQKRHLAEAKKQIRVANDLREVGEQILKDADKEKATVEDARKILETSQKMIRTAMGEPGEIVEVQPTEGPDNGREPIIPLTLSGRVAEIKQILDAAAARTDLEVDGESEPPTG